MQLVGKLEQQSGNSDGVCRVARQILDFFELHVGDYRMSQVCMAVRSCCVCVCEEREGEREEEVGRKRKRERGSDGLTH